MEKAEEMARHIWSWHAPPHAAAQLARSAKVDPTAAPPLHLRQTRETVAHRHTQTHTVCVCVCGVCACVRACVRVCVRAFVCVRACVHMHCASCQVDLALRGAAALVPTSVDVIRTLRESATRGRRDAGVTRARHGRGTDVTWP